MKTKILYRSENPPAMNFGPNDFKSQRVREDQIESPSKIKEEKLYGNKNTY